MAEDSKISWTKHTFNAWRGCTKVSAGCQNCYAETLSARNPAVLGVWGANGTRVVAAEAQWREPLKWDKAAKEKGERHRVFCASLADVFEGWSGAMVDSNGTEICACHECGKWMHFVQQGCKEGCKSERLPRKLAMQDVRARLFHLIEATPNLDWLLLTKRPENVLRMVPHGWSVKGGMDWPPNVWLGTSVENQAAADERIPHLLKVPAKVRFLSCEPLLGPVDVLGAVGRSPNTVAGEKVSDWLHWIIAGGESGPGARPFDLAWARDLRDQCATAGVPFFFKQMGENVASFNGLSRVKFRDKGGNLTDIPADLRVRQFPEVPS